MLIITLRTDKPEAELGLYEDSAQLAYLVWPAHRELAETIHAKIWEMLTAEQKVWPDIGGIVMFKGPGSFTGLRIGASVANALAYSLKVPVAGADGDKWIPQGVHTLLKGQAAELIIPDYGSPPATTIPRK